MKGVSVKDYIYADTTDGVEGLSIFGVPKSGKDNILNRINYHCMKDNKENAIVPGDMFCEFRNLAIHKDAWKELEILVPIDYNIKMHNVPDWIYKHITEVDFKKINIKDHLEDKNSKMLIIYDAFFTGLYFYKRVELWNNIGNQILYRTYDLDKPIIFRFSEAGVFFPQISLKEHWHEVYLFNQMNVDFRKGNVRLQLVSQLAKEIINTVREKQYWTICKRGRYAGVGTIPSKLTDRLPYYANDEYAILYGGIYTGSNRNKKLQESDTKWKMIPNDNIEEYCLKQGLIEKKKGKFDNVDRNIVITIKYLSGGYTHKKLADEYNIGRRHIGDIIEQTKEKILSSGGKEIEGMTITN